MPDPIPYADYVRIEVHAGGQAEIIEFRPDDWQKVKARLTSDYPPARDVRYGGLVREVPVGGLEMTLMVSGPTAIRTRKASNQSSTSDRTAASEAARVGTNAGHGYAWQRPDGVMMKCGGPALCADCSYDKQLVHDAREETR
jgi:hypothetical protein